MAVQSTVPQNGSAEHSAPEGQYRAWCPRVGAVQSKVPKRGCAEQSTRGAVQNNTVPKRDSAEHSVSKMAVRAKAHGAG